VFHLQPTTQDETTQDESASDEVSPPGAAQSATLAPAD